MATTLTNPIAGLPVTHQALTSIQFRFPHKRSADGLNAVINRERVSVTYSVTTYDSQGKEIGIASRSILLADWPAAFKADVTAIYSKVTQDAKANGLIGAGTDEDV